MKGNFQLDPAQWSALRGLLDSALALEPAQRSTWIEQLPPEHAYLKERLIGLLAHAVDGSGALPLDTLPKIETAQFAPGLARGDSVEQAGDLIGHYRLVRPLGAGGMGSVWLAERTDMLQKRPVALKLPRAAWRGARLAERLAREREILAALNHPNIARLYDAGIAADGQPYLALEFVEGERFDAYCARKQLDVPARLRLFLQVARAVAHAHANLVVHRDLKPTNILVSESGEVKLLDFGIAKLLDEGGGRETELTRLGGRALTPDYAAPEQILGRAIGTAADVYALGVVLFELLTGSRPYQLKRDSRAALEEAVLQVDPARPSSSVADPGLRKRLRGDLDTIVLKALKKAPEQRYATVDALAEDVELYLARRPVHAQPDSAWYRARKFVARNRLAVTAAASVFLAVIAGAGVAIWQSRVATEQRDVALREKQRAEEVKSFMLNLFRDAGPQNRPGKVLTTVELLKLAKDRVDQLDPNRVELRVELLGTLGDSLLMLEDANAAEGVLKQAIAEGTAKLDSGHKMVLWSKSMLAQVYRRQGKPREMRAVLEEIVPVLRSRQAEFPNQLLAALVNLVNLDCAEYRFDECRKAVEEGIQVADQRFGGRHPNKILLLTRHAFLLARSGDAEGALAVSSDAVKLALSLHGDNAQHAMVLNARFALARAYGEVERYQEALALFESVGADTERAFRGRTREYGLRLLGAAPFFLQAGQPQRAVTMVDEAMQILSRVQDPDSLILPSAQAGRGQVLLGARRVEAATQALAAALGGFASAMPSTHEFIRSVQHDYALALAYQGRIDAALATLAATAPPSPEFSSELAVRSAIARAVVFRLAGQPIPAAESLTQMHERFRAAGTAVPAIFRPRAQAELLLAGIEAGTRDDTSVELTALVSARPVDQPERADLALAGARVALARGRADTALPLLQKVDVFWSGFDPASRWAGEAAFWLGRCYAELGNAGEARQAHARATKILGQSPLPADAALLRQAGERPRAASIAVR